MFNETQKAYMKTREELEELEVSGISCIDCEHYEACRGGSLNLCYAFKRIPRPIEDYDECECGDLRYSHENDTGRCYICKWNRPTFRDCLQFRLVKKATEVDR